jgi:hypothetical protein
MHSFFEGDAPSCGPWTLDPEPNLPRFYTLLRKRNHTMDSTPITTRQLEALVRLTQARAKMELRELATEQVHNPFSEPHSPALPLFHSWDLIAGSVANLDVFAFFAVLLFLLFLRRTRKRLWS